MTEMVKIIHLNFNSEETYTNFANDILAASKEGYVKTFTIYREEGEMDGSMVVLTKGRELTINDTTEIYLDVIERDVGEVQLEDGTIVAIDIVY